MFHFQFSIFLEVGIQTAMYSYRLKKVLVLIFLNTIDCNLSHSELTVGSNPRGKQNRVCTSDTLLLFRAFRTSLRQNY